MKKKIVLNGIVVGEYESTGIQDDDIQSVRRYLKDRNLWKQISRNDQMFGHANSFAETAISIYKKHLVRSPFYGPAATPFVVNSSFAAELYIKTLHDLEGHSVRGHKLTDLYAKLSPEHKRLIDESALAVRQHFSDDVPDLTASIAMLNEAFEQWRYIYEKDRLEIHIPTVRFVLHTLHEAISRARENAA